MLRKGIISTCLGIVLLMSAAWTTEADEKASKILQESKSKLESLQDFSAKFEFVISNPKITTQPRPRTGDLKYKKGKFAIELDDQQIYCDGVTLWVFLPDDNEVNIMNYDPDEEFTVESIFEIYKASARSRYDGEEKIHNNPCHKIYLAIQDEDLDYNQAYVWINQKTKMLEKVSLIDRKQTTTTYEFIDIRTNLGLSDGTFKFDKLKHPKVTEYDDR